MALHHLHLKQKEARLVWVKYRSPSGVEEKSLAGKLNTSTHTHTALLYYPQMRRDGGTDKPKTIELKIVFVFLLVWVDS